MGRRRRLEVDRRRQPDGKPGRRLRESRRPRAEGRESSDGPTRSTPARPTRIGRSRGAPSARGGATSARAAANRLPTELADPDRATPEPTPGRPGVGFSLRRRGFGKSSRERAGTRSPRGGGRRYLHWAATSRPPTIRLSRFDSPGRDARSIKAGWTNRTGRGWAHDRSPHEGGEAPSSVNLHAIDGSPPQIRHPAREVGRGDAAQRGRLAAHPRARIDVPVGSATRKGLSHGISRPPGPARRRLARLGRHAGPGRRVPGRLLDLEQPVGDLGGGRIGDRHELPHRGLRIGAPGAR